MKRYIMFLFFTISIVAFSGCGSKLEENTNEGTETKTYFEATILSIEDTYLLVEPLEGTSERKIADQINVSTNTIKEEQSLNYLTDLEHGDIVQIGYGGFIAKSYPAQIKDAFEIKLINKAEISDDISKTEHTVVNNLPGVTFDIKKNTLTNKGLTIIVLNESEQNLIFGSYYAIEKEVDGNWFQIPYLEQEYDIGWNDIGYEVKANSSFEFETTNWEWLYGTLDVGNYRFVKNAIVGIDVDITEYYFAVEFTLTEYF